jgi:hypothetical protein
MWCIAAPCRMRTSLRTTSTYAATARLQRAQGCRSAPQMPTVTTSTLLYATIASALQLSSFDVDHCPTCQLTVHLLLRQLLLGFKRRRALGCKWCNNKYTVLCTSAHPMPTVQACVLTANARSQGGGKLAHTNLHLPCIDHAAKRCY